MKTRTHRKTRTATIHRFPAAAKPEALGEFAGAAREAAAEAENTALYTRDLTEVGGMHARRAQEILRRLAQREAEAGKAMASLVSQVKPADLGLYAIDAWQRWVLFLDVLRQRGNTFVSHQKDGCPPVLAYEFDVVVDGSKLERPVNYSLVRIRPPAGVTIREDARPYVIIDPRAGHGSGIGGFKSESEVGVAMHAGHPVYFCIFTTHPTATQTLADVTRAEASFVREVQRRHPNSNKPVIIGNCQGGWAAMLLAATNPDISGPVVVNGAPLSYWSGTRGKNPMRYLGGLFGGILPALLASDLGNGEFDGANLVLNFENLNPSNSLWKKYYDVFADVEGESQRYLDFERWWSGFYFMNEKEIHWLIENLFVGNKLARGGAQLDSRMHVDLRNIRAPMIVFASHGDNITPPPQALNWIADLYSSVQEIKARGQRIVYTVHDSVGHLGIFVSSAVAKKEHKEIVSTLKAIEAMAPGLYEMKIVEVRGEGRDKHFTVDFEERTIDDIRKLDDGRDDERPFAAIARLSSLAAEVYSIAMRPFVRAMTSSAMAQWRVDTQPLRAQRYLLSDQNPLVAPLRDLAQAVRDQRVSAPADNPLRRAEKLASDVYGEWLDAVRDLRDGWVETWFYSVYSSPLMRAVGATELPRISEVVGTDLRAVPEVRQALAQINRGNFAVAVIRMLILLARSRKSVRRDRLDRANELLTTQEPFVELGEEARTRIIHQQNLIVEFEPEQALATLPRLLPKAGDRPRAIALCEQVAGSYAQMGGETREMFARIKKVLEEPEKPKQPTAPKLAAAA